jgi:hypothetical protein
MSDDDFHDFLANVIILAVVSGALLWFALPAKAAALPVVVKNWSGTKAFYHAGKKLVAINKAGIPFLLK